MAMATAIEEKNTHLSLEEQVGKSKRYTRLVASIDKALSESRKSIDTKAAVAECYGADASIFSGGDEAGEDDTTTMLANLIELTIDRVNDRIRSEMSVILEQVGAREKLSAFDKVIDVFERYEQSKVDVENNDRASSKEQAAASRLPSGISAENVLKYQDYAIKVEERDRILSEIRRIEAENETLMSQLERRRVMIGEVTTKVEETGKGIERAANGCSFNGVC